MRFVILAFRNGCKPKEYSVIGLADQFFADLGARDKIIAGASLYPQFGEYHVVCVHSSSVIIRAVRIGFGEWEWQDEKGRAMRNFRRPDGSKESPTFKV